MLIRATNGELIEIVRIGPNRVEIAAKPADIDKLPEQKILDLLNAALEVGGWFQDKGWEVGW